MATGRTITSSGKNEKGNRHGMGQAPTTMHLDGSLIGHYFRRATGGPMAIGYTTKSSNNALNQFAEATTDTIASNMWDIQSVNVSTLSREIGGETCESQLHEGNQTTAKMVWNG